MKFEFKNKNGEKLAGNLELPLSKPRAFALFAHCFTCSKDIIAARTISKTLTDYGIGVLRFDFTGIGNSEGDFANSHFSANVSDLVSACSELSKEYEAPSILIGHSLGGAAVLKAATLLPEVKAVATLGAPSDVAHVQELFSSSLETIKTQGEADVVLAGRTFRINQEFVNDLNESEILEGIRNFKKALLVLHSPIDDTVSVDHAANIFMAARHPKSFVSLDNADHLLMKKEDATYAAKVIGSWLDRYIPSHKEETERPTEGSIKLASREGHKFTQDIYSKDHHIVADEPKKVGGDHLGMNPYDLLLSSLGACTSMTMKMYAARKGLSLDKVNVELKHQKIHAEDCESCETESGLIDQIEKRISIEGDLSEQERSKLFEIAERCSVNKTLQSEINIVSKH